jgi:hypothetical protein
MAGPHKVLIELEDANHHTLDKGTVKFVVPEKTAAEKHHPRGPAPVSNHSSKKGFIISRVVN